MKTIEINGMNLEIDERTARAVTQYRVGDKVKVLIKGYGGTFDVCPGVIVGFCEFKALPTIEILYLKAGAWESNPLQLAYLNDLSEGLEVAPMNDVELLLDKGSVLNKMDAALRTKERELEELRIKRDYFITRFGKAFGDLEQAQAS